MQMQTEERQATFHNDSYEILLSFPPKKREKMVNSLTMLCYGQRPTQRIKTMNGLGSGVTELILNGTPAYRCVYVIADGEIHVLHAFVKTSDGTDKKHEETIKQRYKNVMR